MDIRNLIEQPEYEFLKTNPYLNDMMFFVVGGSHAYGMNTETSDIDLRGVCYPPFSAINGSGYLDDYKDPSTIIVNGIFEQVTERETDTTIYSFHKLLRLLSNCNPNTIEMLGCRTEDYLFKSVTGRYFVDNGNIFLSKRAYNSFAEYARGQFNRLKNALGRQRQGNLSNCLCMSDAIVRMKKHLGNSYPGYDPNSVKVYLTDSYGHPIFINGKQVDPDDVSIIFNGEYKEVSANGINVDDQDIEVRFDVDIKSIPSKDFSGVMNEITSNIKEFDKALGHRNKKKDDLHLNKHAAHLLRLFMMGIDILAEQKIQTYRVKEHDLLMDIRNGKYFDGTSFTKEFFDMADDYREQLDHAYEKTTLPDKPNSDKIRQLAKNVFNHYYCTGYGRLYL